MIREATLDDIPRLLELGQVMHQESPVYNAFPLNEDRVVGFLSYLINSDDGCVFVAIQDGEVIGGMAGIVSEHLWSDIRLAYDIGWFFLPEHRGHLTSIRILQAFLEWAKSKAEQIMIMNTSGVNTERILPLYEKQGFKKAGAILYMNQE